MSRWYSPRGWRRGAEWQATASISANGGTNGHRQLVDGDSSLPRHSPKEKKRIVDCWWSTRRKTSDVTGCLFMTRSEGATHGESTMPLQHSTAKEKLNSTISGRHNARRKEKAKPDTGEQAV